MVVAAVRRERAGVGVACVRSVAALPGVAGRREPAVATLPGSAGVTARRIPYVGAVCRRQAGVGRRIAGGDICTTGLGRDAVAGRVGGAATGLVTGVAGLSVPGNAALRLRVAAVGSDPVGTILMAKGAALLRMVDAALAVDAEAIDGGSTAAGLGREADTRLWCVGGRRIVAGLRHHRTGMRETGGVRVAPQHVVILEIVLGVLRGGPRGENRVGVLVHLRPGDRLGSRRAEAGRDARRCPR